jgi:hypothetical protein
LRRERAAELGFERSDRSISLPRRESASGHGL